MQLIKVGLCAFGMSGKVFHAPFLKEHPGFCIEGIVERNKSDSREKYPNSILYKSVEEMLENDDIQLVVVNTPVQFHFEHVEKALKAGKNVIVEKPFTISTKDAETLVKIAESKNRFLTVYQNRRLDRDFLKVKEIISQNILGEIKEVEIRFDRFRQKPSGKEHKENPNLAGAGTLHDLGAHLVDQATQLFGFPEKIFGDVFSLKGNEFANDYFELILFYKTGLRVRLKTSVLTKEDHYAYKIHGAKGSFLQERTDNQEAELVAGSLPKYMENWQKPLEYPDGILNYLNDQNETERSLTSTKPSDYMLCYQGIYEHIVFGKNLPSPAQEIIQNMKIIDAALESSRSGKVINF